MNVAYYKFDIDDNSGELDSNRPVPFRYKLHSIFTTLNVNDFLGVNVMILLVIKMN